MSPAPLTLSTADTGTVKIFGNLPEIPRVSGTIQSLRQTEAAEREQKGPPRLEAGVVEKDSTILARDGHPIPVRFYSPTVPSTKGYPLVVAFHGGGFCLGGLDGEEADCREFVKRHQCICVNVDYRLAPEYPFPTGVNDSWDALKWIAEHTAELKADPSKGFIVEGCSAGANLAAVVSLMARDKKLSPPLTGELLKIPCLLTADAVPAEYKPLYRSYEQNEDAAILPTPAIQIFWDSYKGDTSSWLFNPFNHPDGHAGLPPVYFQVCGMDPLRDEALIYEKVLREQYGVETNLKVYPGVPHGFWTAFPDLQVSKKFVEDTSEALGWLLDRSKK
ncbi:uncharacterized protein PV07_12522 [Cladophialophora immunda]|uniref:Alpha/beta hydrolase fold-3 domain-containing protein n=1 Tax=Cladophialophora immunda TaxID=569365 RepID=A0A0D1Z391_9EURO|nr:uncharacterized protein PV07_12522 [Cladophialophora immunda]KIW22106.1 hypothetical protein PV07_12522 [Cladophialophora immunda]